MLGGFFPITYSDKFNITVRCSVVLFFQWCCSQFYDCAGVVKTVYLNYQTKLFPYLIYEQLPFLNLSHTTGSLFSFPLIVLSLL